MGKENKKKPRQFSLLSTFVAPTSKITFRLENDKLFAEDGDGNEVALSGAIQQQSYKKSGDKEKTINRIWSEVNSIDPNKALSSFSYIYGIDTNTKEHNGEFLSIGALYKCEFKENDNKGFRALCTIDKVIESSYSYQVNYIEKLFWVKAIDYIKSVCNIKSGEQLALVVDSDLGNIEKYNRREMPIYSNIYLPNNFVLVYASADCGAEYLANKLIRLCDKAATEVLNSRLEIN